jgi:hypothetical protein
MGKKVKSDERPVRVVEKDTLLKFCEYAFKGKLLEEKIESVSKITKEVSAVLRSVGYQKPSSLDDALFQEKVIDMLNESDEPHVFTSYFGNAKILQRFGVVVVSIARFSPRFLSGIASYKEVAPTPAMLKMEEDEYLPKYKAILKNLDAREVFNDLVEKGEGSHVAICCYETPDDFCHRFLVSEWLKKKLKKEIKEFPSKAHH